MRKLAAVFALGVAVWILNVPGVSAAVVRNAHAEAELIPEARAVRPGSVVWVALRLAMEPGWHTYWKNPGDSGMATSVEWSLPEGISAGPMEWPCPERIAEPPLVTYGYRGEVSFLIPFSVGESVPAGTFQTVQARVRWLSCEKICVPGEATLAVALPVQTGGGDPDPGRQDFFVRARAALPLAEHPWKIRAAASGKKMVFELVPPDGLPVRPEDVYFFPEDGEVIDHAAGQVLKATSPGWTLYAERSPSVSKTVTNVRGVFYSGSGWGAEGPSRSLAVDVPVFPLEVLKAAQEKNAGVGLALLFAFLGGLILNLMPCVLPVLSIKILGLIEQVHEDRRRAWRHGLVFSAGVLASFWALALLLVLLRRGGEQIGWGFQLQSPPFLVFLSVLFFVMGMNLFGLFEFFVPSVFLAKSGKTAPGWAASFMSGALATLVATPCTAPFMGSALGFGLSQPIPVAFAVFTCLGAGMASPYLLLTLFPSLRGFVPKPGPWMITLKQFLGFLLMATVFWLASVLGLQRGVHALTALIGGLTLVGFGCWLLGHAQMKPGFLLGRAGWVAAWLCLAGGMSYPFFNLKPGNSSGATAVEPSNKAAIAWTSFSDEALVVARESGKPVFLDFTAAWCLTCRVNERLVLNSQKVAKKFSEMGVIALKADWTSHDEKISRALARYGRNSIPLYVLYGPDPGAEPVILPEILTTDVLIKALDAVSRAGS